MEVITNHIDVRNAEKIGLKEKLKSEIDISLQIKRNCLLALKNISKITENLYLSGAMSLSPETLEALDINYVINVAPELPDTPLPSKDVKYTRIPVFDNLSSNLYDYFDLIADSIHEMTASNKNVLVHCVAGVSRSASLCLAYLMKHMDMTLLQAYNYIKKHRPIVRPNCSFIKQLIKFEHTLYNVNTVDLVFNDHLNMIIPDIYSKDYKSMHEFKKERYNNVNKG